MWSEYSLEVVDAVDIIEANIDISIIKNKIVIKWSIE